MPARSSSARLARAARPWRVVAVAAATLALVVGAALAPDAPTASADGQTCGALDVSPVDGGRYNVQNNRFGTGEEQCVTARAGGFTVDAADGAIAPGGPPKSYPSIVAGCHWGRCTETPGLPVKASQVGGARTAVSITRAPGSWNAAYDLWFNSSPGSDGQNDGTEIMVWIDAQDAPDPIGSVVGTLTVDGAAWAVWQGNIGWDVVSFVREQGATSVELPLEPFVDEAIARGATEPDDWMTSVQFGFEPWSGGAGLAASGFSFQPDGAAPAAGDEGAAPPVDEPGMPGDATEPAEPAEVRQAAGPAEAAPLAPAPVSPLPVDTPLVAPAPTAAVAPALLVQASSGLCLDARGTGAIGDPQVALWGCDPSQGWTPTEGTLVHDWTGACLGAVGGARSAGTAVQLQVCDGHPGQRWQATPTGSLRNAASGLCLAPRGGGASDGTPLVLARCAAAPTWS